MNEGETSHEFGNNLPDVVGPQLALAHRCGTVAAHHQPVTHVPTAK